MEQIESFALPFLGGRGSPNFPSTFLESWLGVQLLNVFKLLLFNHCAVRCKYVEAINLRTFDLPSEVVRTTTIHHFHIDHKAPC